jgi:hypothetical protein
MSSPGRSRAYCTEPKTERNALTMRVVKMGQTVKLMLEDLQRRNYSEHTDLHALVDRILRN